MPAGFWEVNLPADYELAHFSLFIGIFDKAEIAGGCGQAERARSEADECEDYERTDLEGYTCFAKLRLNGLGEPLFDPADICVSTVPWALGQVRTQGLAALNHSSFEEAKSRLMELLQTSTLTAKYSRRRE